MRKTSAPASNRVLMAALSDVAGPNVATIFPFRNLLMRPTLRARINFDHRIPRHLRELLGGQSGFHPDWHFVPGTCYKVVNDAPPMFQVCPWNPSSDLRLVRSICSRSLSPTLYCPSWSTRKRGIRLARRGNENRRQHLTATTKAFQAWRSGRKTTLRR